MDFCTTSILRPDILERTYKSFQERLEGIDLKKCRLFLNIDSFPTSVFTKRKVMWEHTPQENVDVASKFFGEVIYNIPEYPSHSNAVKWLWSNAETEFIFLLEDDRTLIKNINISDMLNLFNKYPNLKQLRLKWREVYPKNYNPLYGLSQSIMRRECYKKFAELISLVNKKSFNPEKFIRSLGIPKKKEVLYYPEFQVTKDIGRQWKISHNFHRIRLRRGVWRVV